MTPPSRTARKTRARTQSALKARLDADRTRKRLTDLAATLHDQRAHLAKLLTFLVATHGEKGQLRISGALLAGLPDTAKLQEEYDRESGDLVLRSVLDPAGTEAAQ